MAMEPLFTRFGPLATQYWGTAAPSASTDHGPFNLGDIVWNTAPAATGSALGWVCTTAGADGSTAVFTAIGLVPVASVTKLVATAAVVPSAATIHAAIIDVAGGTTTDAECRTAVNAILATLRTFGMVTP